MILFKKQNMILTNKTLEKGNNINLSKDYSKKGEDNSNKIDDLIKKNQICKILLLYILLIQSKKKKF